MKSDSPAAKIIFTSIFISVFMALLISSIGCTIYRSPEHKEFESESPQFQAKNLKLTGCSSQSLLSRSTARRLVTVQTTADNNSEFIWELILNDNSTVFESDNLKGDYCVYDYSETE